ncbi:MAG: hypothetical protein KDD50_03175 [Bdellovibrionales bacterium]|nr:hypothetical protein [Bdellovibrionales bacterium]
MIKKIVPMICFYLTVLSLVYSYSSQSFAATLCASEMGSLRTSSPLRTPLSPFDSNDKSNPVVSKIANNKDNFMFSNLAHGYSLYLTQTRLEPLQYGGWLELSPSLKYSLVGRQTFQLVRQKITVRSFNAVIYGPYDFDISNKFGYFSYNTNYLFEKPISNPKELLMRDPRLYSVNIFLNDDQPYSQKLQKLIEDSILLFDLPTLKFAVSQSPLHSFPLLEELAYRFRTYLGFIEHYRALKTHYLKVKEKTNFCRYIKGDEILYDLQFNPDQYLILSTSKSSPFSIDVNKLADDLMDIDFSENKHCKLSQCFSFYFPNQRFSYNKNGFPQKFSSEEISSLNDFFEFYFKYRIASPEEDLVFTSHLKNSLFYYQKSSIQAIPTKKLLEEELKLAGFKSLMDFLIAYNLISPIQLVDYATAHEYHIQLIGE